MNHRNLRKEMNEVFNEKTIKYSGVGVQRDICFSPTLHFSQSGDDYPVIPHPHCTAGRKLTSIVETK